MSRMVDACRAQSVPEPEYGVNGGFVRIVFRRATKGDDSVNEGVNGDVNGDVNGEVNSLTPETPGRVRDIINERINMSNKNKRLVSSVEATIRRLIFGFLV